MYLYIKFAYLSIYQICICIYISNLYIYLYTKFLFYLYFCLSIYCLFDINISIIYPSIRALEIDFSSNLNFIVNHKFLATL